MTNKSVYAAKFKDPRWQKKRLAILERDGFKCTQCSDSEAELHVHHLYYSKARDPWNYPSFSLVTLCHSCHKGIECNDTDDEGTWFGFEWETCVEGMTQCSPKPFTNELWDLSKAIHFAVERGVDYSELMKYLTDLAETI